MTTDFDLISTVQPKEGWFCAVGIKGSSVVQKLVHTREELDKVSAQFVAEKRNAFFAVARFETDESRKKENVKALKALWLDIDCGPTKAEIDEKTGRPGGYVDQVTALTALKSFCMHIGLPKPILVNSGRGIHVYWELDREVTPNEWEPVASKLRELCIKHDLYVDTNVFEISRVLRVPGTFNFKDDPPNPVTVMSIAKPVSFDEICKILNVDLNLQKTQAPKKQLTALGKQFVDSTTTSFDKILRLSQEGKGCAQILDCYENRSTLTEPRWFDALSIAKFCDDSDTAIHTLSEGHPDYDPSAVEYKIKHILGPRTCEKFEESNPSLCEGCPFKGSIKSPIVLGREVEKANEEDNIIHIENDGVKEVYKIPEYPFPFFRGKNGGVWFNPDGDEVEPIHVYEHDLYVLKRMKDPVEGDVVVMKLHTPHDGIYEFILANAQLTEPKEVRKLLAKHGVLCATSKKAEMLSWYVIASVRELQSKKKAEKMRLQFGWADNDSKFIIGDKEVTPEGIFHSPPSPSTESFVENMQCEGSFEKWKEVFSLYGKKGMEPQAFAALSAFGAPLLKYTGQTGALISLVNTESGTGKTTALYMQNSVWGHPQNLTGLKEDTMNAKFLRLGIHNNLPVTLDELTECSPAEVSHLAYGISQGKGKERMLSSANALRKNLTSWCTIVTTSANSSMYETLSSVKNAPEGEMMRILEYKIEKNPDFEADPTIKYMFDIELKENYGHAGEIYAEHLVSNLEYWKGILRRLQEKFDHECKITQKERFWSAVISANLTGGLIASKLGLIDWDMDRMYHWCIANLMSELREEVHTPVDNTIAIIGDFINRFMQNILVVNDEVDARSHMPSLPIMEPRGNLCIRFEPDTKMMYISAKAFKEYCVQYRINYKSTLKELERKGVLMGTVNKRMSKGMKVNSPPTRALHLDCSNSEFLDVDSMFANMETTENAGGEG